MKKNHKKVFMMNNSSRKNKRGTAKSIKPNLSNQRNRSNPIPLVKFTIYEDSISLVIRKPPILTFIKGVLEYKYLFDSLMEIL